MKSRLIEGGGRSPVGRVCPQRAGLRAERMSRGLQEMGNRFKSSTMCCDEDPKDWPA